MIRLPPSRAGLWATMLLASAGTARAQNPPPYDAARAHTAAMRSDLRNLVTAQEAFFVNHVRYSASLDSLRFIPSQGVAISIDRAGNRGWNATARHPRAGMCVIYVGNAPKPRPDAREGEPSCDGSAGRAGGADSIAAMMGPIMGPMMSDMMTTMYEQIFTMLARPETAERLATFTRNYYDALIRLGFTREDALRLAAAVGVPAFR